MFRTNIILAALAIPAIAHADDRPDAHAPLGIMADHTHKAGGVMFSYRFMHMAMGGTRIGTSSIDPDSIVTTVPNRFATMPGQPPTLRVAPLSMRTDMHMLGFMYAPRDWVTLMMMGSFLSKEMTHRTYAGGMGTATLGGFKTTAKGFGDTSLIGIFPIIKRNDFELNMRVGTSIPTGSQTRADDVLTPMNMRPVLRLPYAMQLGSGTWDLLPGVTAKGREGRWGWGAQYQGTIRTGTNDQGYRLGDTQMATIWTSYMPAPWISTSARIAGRTATPIHGIDPNIVAPVQTADPANYGGQRLDAYLGANFVAANGALKGYRVGLEVGIPIYQDLNGPQMSSNLSLGLGIQKAF